MPQNLTLFEHEYTERFDWTEGEPAAVERMNRGAGAQLLRPAVRAGRRELQAAQHVGVVRFAGRTAQILPKLHRPGRASAETSSTAPTPPRCSGNWIKSALL